MMKRKIIYLILILFVLTGCHVDMSDGNFSCKTYIVGGCVEEYKQYKAYSIIEQQENFTATIEQLVHEYNEK